MIVYRIENSQGTGFYQPYTTLALNPDCHCPVRHPEPFNDGIEDVEKDEDYFGFASILALKQWFPKEIRLLMPTDDMRVGVYEVADRYVKIGYRQLVFKRHIAKHLHALDPVYFSRIPKTRLNFPTKIPMFGKNQEENSLFDVVCC